MLLSEEEPTDAAKFPAKAHFVISSANMSGVPLVRPGKVVVVPWRLQSFSE